MQSSTVELLVVDEWVLLGLSLLWDWLIHFLVVACEGEDLCRIAGMSVYAP